MVCFYFFKKSLLSTLTPSTCISPTTHVHTHAEYNPSYRPRLQARWLTLCRPRELKTSLPTLILPWPGLPAQRSLTISVINPTAVAAGPLPAPKLLPTVCASPPRAPCKLAYLCHELSSRPLSSVFVFLFLFFFSSPIFLCLFSYFLSIFPSSP